MTLKRITITIPEDVLAAADLRARELDRSRSWVIADAVRRCVAGSAHNGAQGQPSRGVREPSTASYAAREVSDARRQHLRAELALPPAERLHRAEELGKLARQAQNRGRREQVISFESYEDYYEWKKRRLIGG